MKAVALSALTCLALLGAGPQPGTAATTASVTILDFAFVPFTVTVDLNPNVSNQITFSYVADGFANHRPHGDIHNQVNEGACFNISQMLFPGDSATATITLNALCLESAIHSGGPDAVSTEGPVLSYHCDVHPGMRGKIVLNLV